MSKNSSGGDSSLGLEEGDESEEGRQLHSQTRCGWGAVGREYPMEVRPSNSGRACPSAPKLLQLCCPGDRQGTCQISRRPCQGLGCSEKCWCLRFLGGHSAAPGVPSCVHMQPAPSRAQGVQSWLSLSWELGTSLHTQFCGAEPQGGPCLSPAAPRGVCGEGLSQPCPRHPL